MDDGDSIILDILFYGPDTFSAIATDPSSRDPVWFVYIVSQELAMENVSDDFGHSVAAGQSYLVCNYLEKHEPARNGYRYHRNQNKVVFVFKESIVYPFVNFKPTGKKEKFFLADSDLCDIIYYIENSKMAFL